MGQIVSLLSFYKNGYGIKKPMKVDMPFNKEANEHTLLILIKYIFNLIFFLAYNLFSKTLLWILFTAYMNDFLF